jgi:hypothetical protein
VLKALDLIQRAQSLVGAAAQLLCPVDGFAGQWTDTNRLYHAINAHWHSVNGHRVAGPHVLGGEAGQS